eukprot:EG_transcript_18318
MAVWLAAPDETVSWAEAQQFASHPLTTKLGGAPAWLLPPAVASPPDPRCEQCRGPMALVVQAHAPVAHVDNRVLYVFGCRSGRCPGSWKVYRCQLAGGADSDSLLTSKNDGGAAGATFAGAEFDDEFEEPAAGESFKGDEFGSVNPEPTPVVDTAPTFAGDEFEEQGQGQEEVKEEEDEEEEDKEENVGSDCPVIPEDLPARTSASSSRLCNVVGPAGGLPTRGPLSTAPLRPICLEFFPEPEGGPKAEEKELQRLRKQMKQLAMDDAPGEEYEAAADKVFSRFSKRLAKYPKQCLRWSLGGAPLPIQQRRPPPGSGLPGTAVAPPRCPACGAARQFEMQVLPT